MFSILINCHNQANYIEECILSSLNQNYENFEVIVVDSSDIKLNLEKFKSRKNFKYFHIERFSKYPEGNQMYKVELGFKESSGDYICLLDADDKFSDNKLNKLNEYIKSNNIIINQDIPFLINEKALVAAAIAVTGSTMTYLSLIRSIYRFLGFGFFFSFGFLVEWSVGFAP